MHQEIEPPNSPDTKRLNKLFSKYFSRKILELSKIVNQIGYPEAFNN